MVSKRQVMALLIAAVLIILSGSIAWAHSTQSTPERAAQADTPVPLQFPTPTETPGPPTETPTRTPTSEGRPMVEAISNDTNVRAEPDINGSLMGKIYPGDLYPVNGKRFDWYQIEFPESPNGIAWVYKDVVNLHGDETLIPELELEDIPTVDPAYLAAQETLQAITSTPGAVASLTAQFEITPTGVFTAAPGSGPTLEPGAPLPTYTNPPMTTTPVIVPRSNPSSQESGLPPIVPLLALGALGLMGLLVSILRRL